MTHLASNSLDVALEVYYNAYEPDDIPELGQDIVDNSGHEWLEVRGYFLRSYVKGIIGSIYNFACALFNTFRSLFQGNLGRDKALRDKAIKRYKNTAVDIRCIFISFVGLFTPKGAAWIYEKFEDEEDDDDSDDIKPLI